MERDVTSRRAWAWAVVVIVALAVSLSADTLIMRDGERVQGELIAIRDGVVEFDAQRGFFRRERVRVDVAEVSRIEFDQSSRPDSSYNGNSGDARTGGASGNNTAPSRPPGMRERSVTVNANEPWRDTGVTVRAGQT